MRGTPLGGSTVLITGGGSGIGRRMAIGAARRGAKVVIWDVNADRGTAVRDDIRAHRLPCEAFAVDVTDKAAVRATAAATGPVDVLINNAGVVSGRPLLETSDAAIERTMAVNVLALYWVTKAFLPGMVARGRGTVVTVASAAGLVGVARQTDYSASKWAAVGFTESLRAELRLARTGVRTLVVCPYYIDTGMFDGVQSKFGWLLPILKEGDVARKVLDAVASGRQQLVLPPLAGLIPPARMLPVPVFDAFCDVMGINQTMAHFTGRPGDVLGRDDGEAPASVR